MLSTLLDNDVEVAGITVTIHCLQLNPVSNNLLLPQLMPLNRELGTVISVLQMKVSY